MKFKNYKNTKTGNDKIYSDKNFANMTLSEIFNNREELIAQHKVLGFPNEAELAVSGNVVHIEAYTREDGTEVKAHWRSKPNSGNDVKGGSITGAAARIDRTKEPVVLSKLPKNNDEFFEKERNNPQSWLMRINGERNSERPDAKLLMDIALVNPDKVPSTQDYQVVGIENSEIMNKKYGLTGTNKEIPAHYRGVEFSADSPTAQRLNKSEELKKEIFNEQKNYDSKTGEFKSDKLEIEFKEDKNLQYSFGHMTILDPKISDGYVTGLAYDKYDFEANYKYISDYNATKLNNNAKLIQMSSHLKNYYTLVPIKIKIQ